MNRVSTGRRRPPEPQVTSEAKISRDEVQRIVRAANLYGWSNRWLVSYSRRLAER